MLETTCGELLEVFESLAISVGTQSPLENKEFAHADSNTRRTQSPLFDCGYLEVIHSCEPATPPDYNPTRCL